MVNVACQCGYTKTNYEELAKLLEDHHEAGLRVLLFPCNQFGLEEFDSSEQVKRIVHDYSTKFSIFEKIDVKGDEAIPLYKYLQYTCQGSFSISIKRNFTKFLVNRQGRPVARFGPNENPASFAAKVQALLKE